MNEDVQQPPDFALVGAPRAATSSVYRWLKDHPSVFMPGLKEPRYFLCGVDDLSFEGPADRLTADNIVCDPEAYCQLFADAEAGQMKGDGSTDYLYSREAALQMRDHNPGLKIVIIVRNPLDRAISAFRYLKSMRLEPAGSFRDGVSAEAKRMEQGWSPIYWYMTASEYSKWIPVYDRVFGREQVHLMVVERFHDQWRSCADSLCSFLGVEQRKAGLSRTNRSGRASIGWLYRLLVRPTSAKNIATRVLPDSWMRAVGSVLQSAALSFGKEEEGIVSPRWEDLIIEQREYLESRTEGEAPTWGSG